MERRIFFKAAVLCLAMIAGCISLTACSNDDDEPEVTNDLTTIKTAFSVSLSEDWYMFFDIEVKYVSETGEQTVTLTQDWSFDAEIFGGTGYVSLLRARQAQGRRSGNRSRSDLCAGRIHPRQCVRDIERRDARCPIRFPRGAHRP